jgi:hypothetical protein
MHHIHARQLDRCYFVSQSGKIGIQYGWRNLNCSSLRQPHFRKGILPFVSWVPVIMQTGGKTAG